MNRMARVAWILGIAVAAGAVGVGVWRPSGSEILAASGAAELRALPAHAAAERRYAPDRDLAALELVYAVDLETRLENRSNGAAHTLVGSMTWTLSPVESADGELHFAARVQDVSVVADSGVAASAGRAESVADELRHPFALRFDRSGRLVAVGVDGRGGVVSQSIIRSAGSSLQFVHTKSGSTKHWVATESDHFGEFTARYAEQAAGVVTKEKAYARPNVPGIFLGKDTQPPTVVARSMYAFSARAPLPSKVEALEQIEAGSLSSRSTSILTLKSTRRTRPRAATTLTGFRYSGLQDPLQPVQRDAVARSRELVAGAGFSDLWNGLKENPASGGTLAARHGFYNRMVALFDVDLGAVKDAEHSLRTGRAGKDAAAMLGALSDSTSTEAHQALVAISKDASLPVELREAAITNLALGADPPREVFADLNELARSEEPEVRNAAVLGLGTSARNGAQGETKPLAEEAVNGLTQQFSSAATHSERVLLLDALGNAGAGLPAIEQALQDPEEDVRAAALGALRFVPGPEVDSLIAKAWLTDVAAVVRRQAPFAAGYRAVTPVLAQAAVQSLSAEADTPVRVDTLAYMAENRELPEFLRALETAAASDRDTEVQRTAARLLSSR